MGLGVLVVDEIARPLHQPEGPRVLVGEGRDLQPRRIAQRPPQPLARAIDDPEPVAVMHRIAEIIDPRPPLRPEKVHGGQRRDPTAFISRLGISTERTCITVSTRAPARSRRRRRRIAVEQRAQAERPVAGLRLLYPEGGEDRKLLRVRPAGPDREPARRKPVDAVVRDRPEVARALEHRELVPHPRPVQRIAQADAAEAHLVAVPSGAWPSGKGKNPGSKSKKSVEKPTGTLARRERG